MKSKSVRRALVIGHFKQVMMLGKLTIIAFTAGLKDIKPSLLFVTLGIYIVKRNNDS